MTAGARAEMAFKLGLMVAGISFAVTQVPASARAPIGTFFFLVGAAYMITYKPHGRWLFAQAKGGLALKQAQRFGVRGCQIFILGYGAILAAGGCALLLLWALGAPDYATYPPCPASSRPSHGRVSPCYSPPAHTRTMHSPASLWRIRPVVSR
jgi:hypothetical protein